MKYISSILTLALLLHAGNLWAVVYVDTNALGAGNGNSWTDAYNNLGPALTDADVANEQVWVANGTYTGTLSIPDGVEVYGGFEGFGGAAETLLSQRNVTANPVTLDLQSLNLVTIAGVTHAVLDGFTLINPTNVNNFINVNTATGVQLNNLTIPDLGSSFGAINLVTSAVSAKGLVIKDDGGAGGSIGIDVTGTSTLTLSNSLFAGLPSISIELPNGGNTADVRNCTFDNVGWGLRDSAAIPSSATNCIFTNILTGWAAQEATLGGDIVLKNCLFFGNGGADIREEGSTNVLGATNINAIPGNSNNVSGDPKYTNAAGGNYTLANDSAAIDVGLDASAPTTDLAGSPRNDNPVVANGPTGSSDIGAYEGAISLTPVELSTFEVE